MVRIAVLYIRVNRSRFWSTDCGEDKQNAYAVLFYAIRTITQIMAPIILGTISQAEKTKVFEKFRLPR